MDEENTFTCKNKCSARYSDFADKNGHLANTCKSACVYVAKNMSEIF